MSRIRTLKPEFWGDEKMACLDSTTRLVFLALISLSDDAGRLVDNVKTLDGIIFPETDDTCADALDTLARMSRVDRYRAASGQRIIQLVNWTKHQKVDKPGKYVLPGPPPQHQENQDDTESSRHSREDVATSSENPRAPTYDLRPTTYDHVPPICDTTRAREDDAYIGQRVNELWRELKLPSPRGYNWLEGAMRVSTLTEHFTDAEILAGVRRLATTPGLSWATKKGPAYLAETHKGGVRVLQTVLDWTDFDTSGAANGTPSKLKVDNVRDETGCPVHDDPEKRRHLIQARGDLWRRDGRWVDPDPGHPWTLEDDHLNEPDTYPERKRREMAAKIDAIRARLGLSEDET